jgi:hypothetical protein|tara:strand:- start:508 stop:783 length:276 start_codon:yes stop_codon:yes gene_type:complete
MTVKEMIELIQQHHPHLGEKEIVNRLNRAKDDFCARTEIVKDSYTATANKDQRYYTISANIIKIQSVWLNDVQIPMLLGKPTIDDDTGESE